MITIEELRADLLEELSKELPQDGINQLLRNGRYYTRVESPLLSADHTASEAVLHTGAYAWSNGIAERQPIKRDRQGQRTALASVFEDKGYLGYATSANFSPLALTAPTIGDNLKRALGSNALVYSVAPHPEEAIIGAGLYGNAAYWIDKYTGRWASSTYYSRDFAWFIDKGNGTKESLPSRLDSGITWKPSKSGYPLGSGGTFSHRFKKTYGDISDFIDSPLVNDEVISTAVKLLEYTDLGKDDVTDFLSLHLTAADGNKGTSDLSAEVIDSYYRVDRSIAQLLKQLDLKQTLVVLAGNGQSREYPPAIIDDRRLFKTDRCLALVNMYLHAEYGMQGLVEEITPSGKVYLNRQAIKQNGRYQLQEIQSAVSDFLLEFSGVAYAVEEHRLRHEALSGSLNRAWLTALNSATNADRPDVVFGLLPSWIVQDRSKQGGVEPYRMVATPTIFVMLHPTLKSETIEVPLPLHEVATKIAWVLKIRPPTP